jgi:hypothetical protein
MILSKKPAALEVPNHFAEIGSVLVAPAAPIAYADYDSAASKGKGEARRRERH